MPDGNKGNVIIFETWGSNGRIYLKDPECAFFTHWTYLSEKSGLKGGNLKAALGHLQKMGYNVSDPDEVPGEWVSVDLEGQLFVLG
tara:strand:- start:88 stop:345 length:258 start_codon:yes stop_codon:yes gene_type:complete